jgi:hypothetical protein
MTASAWSYGTRGSPDAFSRALLGQWPTGLGVLNKDEVRGRWFFDHPVDNRREADYVLFLFDQPVDLVKVVIDPCGFGDSDVMYWSELVTEPVDLTGLPMDEIVGLGYEPTLDAGLAGCSPRTIHLSSAGPVNALLLGVPLPCEGPDRNVDKFKIRLLEVACIPEPSSVGLFLVGATGVLLLRRKR